MAKKLKNLMLKKDFKISGKEGSSRSLLKKPEKKPEQNPDRVEEEEVEETKKDMGLKEYMLKKFNELEPFILRGFSE